MLVFLLKIECSFKQIITDNLKAVKGHTHSDLMID